MKMISFAKHISWQTLPNHEFAYVYNIRERKYYLFEDTELEIWNCIARHERIDVEEIITKLSEYYEISKEEIDKDIRSFIDALYEIGVIECNGRDKY